VWCDAVLKCGVMTMKTMPYMFIALLKAVAVETSTRISISFCTGGAQYKGTSLIRNTPLLEPYSRTLPRVLW